MPTAAQKQKHRHTDSDTQTQINRMRNTERFAQNQSYRQKKKHRGRKTDTHTRHTDIEKRQTNKDR